MNFKPANKKKQKGRKSFLTFVAILSVGLLTACGKKDATNDDQRSVYANRFAINNGMANIIEKVVNASPCYTGQRFEITFNFQGSGPVTIPPFGTEVQANLFKKTSNIINDPNLAHANVYVGKTTQNDIMVFKDRGDLNNDGASDYEVTLSLCRNFQLTNTQQSIIEDIAIYNFRKHVSQYCDVNQITSADVRFDEIFIGSQTNLVKKFYPIHYGNSVPDVCRGTNNNVGVPGVNNGWQWGQQYPYNQTPIVN